MSYIDTDKLIDSRNRALWEDLNTTYEITLVESTDIEYRCYSEMNKSIIYVPLNNYCPDSFTHELLHIYLRKKEIFIGANFQLTIASSKILNNIFSSGLLEHIGNCLDHIKMLPKYLELGFAREKFLLDYYTPKCTDIEIKAIEKGYKNGKAYNIQAIDFYIGKYIGMRADPNIQYNYEEQYKKLQKIDKALFNAVEKFINSWENYAIEVSNNSYRDITSNFYNNLKPWITNKVFV